MFPAVPSSRLEPFTVPGLESADPLETIAKLRQGRAQQIQLQNMQMQQQQIALKQRSQQAMLRAMQAGGTPEEMIQRMTASGMVSPDDIAAFQAKSMEYRKNLSELNKADQAQLDRNIDQYLGEVEVSGKSWAELKDINARAEARGLFKAGGKTFEPVAEWETEEQLQAQIGGLKGVKAILAERKERAAAAASEAARAASEAATKKTGLDITAGERTAAIADVRAAIDPKTREISPPAWKALFTKHPALRAVPGFARDERPSADSLEQFIESEVAVEKLPEYRTAKAKEKLGIMGTGDFDMYMARFAQDKKTPLAELPFEQYREGVQQYAKDKNITDPNMIAALLGLRGAQSQLAQAQAASVLTPRQIEDNARDLLNGDLGVDQIKELRAGRVNQGAQIIERARALAKAEGKPFSLLELEMFADQRQRTLREFTSTLVSHAGGQRIALNTLIHHADLYMDAAAALKNGTFRPGNEAYNRIATLFGAAPPTNAALLAQFFASETGKVATGGVPAEREIQGILANMGTSGSPEAMMGAGQTLLGIAAGRMIPLKELRDKAKLEKFVDILGPDAREILERRGFDPETMKPRKGASAGGKIQVPLKSGKVALFDTREQAEGFKKKYPDRVK